ncbi:nuclear transport factor 2 family protein [Coleofasciculus sp.]|uniref:nuclear transport factor 2 family protein n=1 Tax=Coleofasciculus sp. TaxID=3100458 RepID=UPI003A4C344B
MSTKPIEALVRTYFTKVAAMNPDGWLDDFAEDAVSYDPVGQPPTKVHEGFQEFFAQLQGMFKQLESTIEHIFVAGNEAAVKWTMQGLSKSDKTITFEGITVFEVNEAGKIQSTRAYWNPADMIAQLKQS